MAVIEFARNVLKIKNAGSTEFDKRIYPVIGLINEWSKDGLIIKGTDRNLGGTMRLGLYDALLKNNSAIKKIYKSTKIKERHRHRYEVNNNLREKFEKNGLIFSGMSPDNKLPEIIELNSHPWFIGVQFHPEFKSRPLGPHPLLKQASLIMQNKIVNCNGIEISNKNKICLIAGPCQLETEQHAMDMVGKIKEITEKYKIGLIYKTSFDKANRTSLQGKRGAGLEKSLPIFDKIKKENNIPVLTDIHNEDQCSIVAPHVDVLQIPASVSYTHLTLPTICSV